jgi:hypothetical protein
MDLEFAVAAGDSNVWISSFDESFAEAARERRGA